MHSWVRQDIFVVYLYSFHVGQHNLTETYKLAPVHKRKWEQHISNHHGFSIVIDKFGEMALKKRFHSAYRALQHN